MASYKSIKPANCRNCNYAAARAPIPCCSGGGRGRAIPCSMFTAATFPSALSVAYRFDGRSWADHLHRTASTSGLSISRALAARRGRADECARPPNIRRSAARRTPPPDRRGGRSYPKQRDGARVHIVAHSWGTHRGRTVRRRSCRCRQSSGVVRSDRTTADRGIAVARPDRRMAGSCRWRINGSALSRTYRQAIRRS